MRSEQFRTIWRLCVVLCAVLAVFTTLFVSCTRADGRAAQSGDNDAPATVVIPLEEVQTDE